MEITLRVVLALFFLTAYLSCEPNDTPTPINDLVKGEWEWTGSSGGFGGISDTPASTGVEERLVFGEGATYSRYSNGVLSATGKYVVRKKTCIHDGQKKPVIIFSDEQELMVEQLDATTLDLSHDVHDGINYHYKRSAQPHE